MICAINRFDYLYTTKLSGFGTKKKIEFVCEIKFKIRGLNVITSQIFCTTFYAYSLPTAFIFILSLGYGFFFFAKKTISKMTSSRMNAGMPLLLKRLNPMPDRLRRM